MTITAKVIAHSVADGAPPIVTLELKYPRMIHSEFLRHRPLSHSVASSRAIPVATMLRNIMADPAEPVKWGSNRPGMQAGKSLEGRHLKMAQFAWHMGKSAAIASAWLASKAGAHKEIANRITEPYSHTVEIVTGTDWDSFFELRIHEHADPTICRLATTIKVAMDRSEPALLKPGFWHLPYVTPLEKLQYDIPTVRDLSAARCARVSYLNHDQSKPDFEKDMALAEKLRASAHWSPFEHQATPDERRSRHFAAPQTGWLTPELHGNLTGWQQGRKLIEVGR